jgi:hypothetical protein
MGGTCSTHTYKILVGKRERNYLEDLGVDGKIIIE